MAANLTLIISSYYFLLLASALSFSFMNQAHARVEENKKSHKTLILGLAHSMTTLRTPKSSVRQPSEMSDIMEPLREIRDGYIMSLNLGTPPQVIQVYMDTGSDLTWVPCGNLSFVCMDCDYMSKMTTTFSPFRSSSSVRDTCDSHSCIDIHSSDNSYDPCTVAGCSLSALVKSTCLRPCPSFAYTYGGQGVVTGTLTLDTLKVHGTTAALREIPNFSFGCVGSTYREPIGIVGFGKGILSLPSQLGFRKSGGFSHCFLPFKFANNPNISSPLVVGSDITAVSSSKDINLQMQFTPMLKSPMYPNYYYIGLEGITLISNNNNTQLNLTQRIAAPQVPVSLKEFDSLGNGGMLIDSGTTYTHLPQPFYSQLLSALQLVITYPRANEVEERTGFDLCYKIPCPYNTSTTNADLLLPSITFHFLNNVSLELPQGNHFYAMGAPSNGTVVKCLLFQGMDDSDYGPAGVFGSFQQQNMEVVYDLEKERIGFQPMDCVAVAALQGLQKT